MKIKKGDEVKVLVGKDKGKTGKVEKVLRKTQEVLVSGVNQFKRHVKARSEREKSEVKTIIKPLAVSKIALVCPKCHKPTRVGYMVQKDEKKRMCRKCKKVIE